MNLRFDAHFNLFPYFHANLKPEELFLNFSVFTNKKYGKQERKTDNGNHRFNRTR